MSTRTGKLPVSACREAATSPSEEGRVGPPEGAGKATSRLGAPVRQRQRCLRGTAVCTGRTPTSTCKRVFKLRENRNPRRQEQASDRRSGHPGTERPAMCTSAKSLFGCRARDVLSRALAAPAGALGRRPKSSGGEPTCGSRGHQLMNIWTGRLRCHVGARRGAWCAWCSRAPHVTHPELHGLRSIRDYLGQSAALSIPRPAVVRAQSELPRLAPRPRTSRQPRCAPPCAHPH